MKNLFFVFCCLCLVSCKTIIYQYNSEHSGIATYVIKSKNEVEFYCPPKKNQLINLFSFRTDKDSIEFAYEPYAGVSYKKSIRSSQKQLVIENDTLEFVAGVIQKNKKGFDHLFASFLSFSGNVGLLGYEGNFDVEYIGDSIHSFRNQEYERTHMFRMFPSNSDSINYPILVGFSAKTGIPVYNNFYNYYPLPYPLEIICNDYTRIRMRKARIKKVLM